MAIVAESPANPPIIKPARASNQTLRRDQHYQSIRGEAAKGKRPGSMSSSERERLQAKHATDMALAMAKVKMEVALAEQGFTSGNWDYTRGDYYNHRPLGALGSLGLNDPSHQEVRTPGDQTPDLEPSTSDQGLYSEVAGPASSVSEDL